MNKEPIIEKPLLEKTLLFEIMTLSYYGEQCLDNRIAIYLNGEPIGYTTRDILAMHSHGQDFLMTANNNHGRIYG